MTCNHGEEAMDVDDQEEAKCQAHGLKLNGLHLYPVAPLEVGQGLPYAPVDWPKPGDKWGWRVGKRTSPYGFYYDRYLYPPSSLRESHGKGGMSSKLSIKQFLQTKFPAADVNAFFASFSWKIPASTGSLVKDNRHSSIISEEMMDQSVCDSQDARPFCKARNRLCPFLIEDEEGKASPEGSGAMFCDICCSETNFCRDCCCILCYKTISLGLGGHTFIKCQAKYQDQYQDDLICGHVAHLVCALRSYMAGTVGGSIGLDTEYYCLRCDARTQLVDHVSRILEFCGSIQSRDDIKKLLDLGICLLRGSRKKDAQRLFSRTQSALGKLESGAALTDVWKVEDDEEVAADTEDDNKTLGTVGSGDEGIIANEQSKDADVSELQNKNKIIEQEIDEILGGLRSAQQYEYELAQKKLISQRDKLFHLYQSLEKKKFRLVKYKQIKTQQAIKESLLRTERRIEKQEQKLKEMGKVTMGFGRTPRDILKEYFGLDV